MKNSILRKSVNATFWNGITDSVVKGLTTGPLLTAYVFSFGMGNVILGFLQAIVSVSNLLQLPVSHFLDKGMAPKKIALISSLSSRPFLLLMGCSFLFVNKTIGGILFAVSFALFYILSGLTGGAFWPWCKKLVPSTLMTSFFAHRIRYILLAKTLTVTTAMVIIALLKEKYAADLLYGYAVFLVLAFMTGLYYTYTLFQMSDVVLDYREDIPFLQKIVLALKNREFNIFFLKLGLHNFALAFFSAFSIAFLIKGLGMSVASSMFFSIGCAMVDILVIGWWNKYAKKHGTSFLLMRSSLFFMAAVAIFMCLAQQGKCVLWLLILGAVLVGSGNSGMNLAISDAVITKVPPKSSSLYISIMNIGRFGFYGAGAMIAGIVLDVLETYTLAPWLCFFAITELLFMACVAVRKCDEK